ncbi:MAG: DUF4126 domain-containing protein [Nitrospira sp.]|nr:DUF4126 domain-containing protein [Nitrospira sp.]MDE0404000.1 DUF4126 domain-containing protein [Nitrospira sp.]MDE0485876.1 DUF4126 domain-containing protein [Nitrospira sp.]
MDHIETILGILIGFGLSVACGFRLLIPLLSLSIADQTGYLELADGFTWLGDWPALIGLSIATTCEVITSKFPIAAEILDVVEAPFVVIAGVMLELAMITDLPPFLEWGLAVIAGGSAGLVHAGDAFLRPIIGGATAGFGEPVFSASEDAGSGIFSILAITLPMLPTEVLVFVSILFLVPILCGAVLFVFLIKKLIGKRRQVPA